MRNRAVLLVVLAFASLAVVVPCGAQGVGKSCDISGTWYGGSDPAFQYLWTITPTGAGRYSVLYQPGFDNRPFGYVTWTTWAGEVVKIDARTYDAYGMSYWVWAPGAAPAGVDETLPEVDIVHSRVQLIDCNTLTASLDVYAGYFSFTPAKTPFVTPPDIDWLQILYGGATVVETYHRMPTTLAPLPPAATAGVTGAAASKPTRPPTAAVSASKARR
jgi:hypothetical protein